MVTQKYKVGKNKFGIRTTSERFAEWLDYALGEYRFKGKCLLGYSVVINDEPTEDATKVGRQFHSLNRGSLQVIKSLDMASVGRMLLGELDATLVPDRRDGIYVEYALLRRNGTTALLPGMLLAYVGGLRLQVRQAGITLPYAKYVAVEPSSGLVVPVKPKLKVPEDAIERLEQLDAGGAAPERRPLSEPTPVDLIYTFVSAGHAPVMQASRGLGLHHLLSNTMNLELLGGDVLDGLARLASGAQVQQLAFNGQREMLRAVTDSMAGLPAMPTA